MTTEKMTLEFDLTDPEASRNAERALKSGEIFGELFALFAEVRSGKKYGSGTIIFNLKKKFPNLKDEDLCDIMEVFHESLYDWFSDYIRLIET